MMPPLTINGRFLTRSITGVDRFALELLKAWLPRHGGTRAATLALPSTYGRVMPIPAGALGLAIPMINAGWLKGHPWEQLQLARLSPHSILVNLCNSAPVLRSKQLTVLHDAGVVATPESYSPAYRRWHRWLMTRLLRSRSVVATVSTFSASELMRHFGVNSSRLELIYEGGEHIVSVPSDTRIFDRLGVSGTRYILAVGSRNPNKNLIALIKAMGLLTDLDVKLIAAGGSNARVFGNVDARSDALLSAGYVTDAELRALYERAECFVFPSLYEGFGLPPLEAMYCGCPVAVADRASLPEVCGDAALYFNPDDPTDIAQVIRKILTSQNLREDLRAAGLVQAQKFSWDKAADQFESILDRQFGLASEKTTP